jgi:hypothetical protein
MDTQGAAKQSFIFYEMRMRAIRTLACIRGDVIMSFILFAAQIIVTLLAFVGELHEDPRFADEKMIYRS